MEKVLSRQPKKHHQSDDVIEIDEHLSENNDEDDDFDFYDWDIICTFIDYMSWPTAAIAPYSFRIRLILSKCMRRHPALSSAPFTRSSVRGRVKNILSPTEYLLSPSTQLSTNHESLPLSNLANRRYKVIVCGARDFQTKWRTVDVEVASYHSHLSREVFIENVAWGAREFDSNFACSLLKCIVLMIFFQISDDVLKEGWSQLKWACPFSILPSSSEQRARTMHDADGAALMR